MKLIADKYGCLGVAIFGALLSLGATAQPPEGAGPLPFKVFDTDKNGLISEAEFLEVQQRQHPGAANSGAQMPADFAFFDTDGTGAITPPELIAGQQLLIQRHRKQMMHQPAEFGELDSNGDEQIDVAEFTSFHEQRMQGMQGQGMANMAGNWAHKFETIDTDHSGSISLDEFNAHHASMGK